MTRRDEDTRPAVEFPHGVASGDPTQHSAVIWTTVDGRARTVRWEVAEDETFRTVVASGTVELEPSSAARHRPVSVTVTELPADTSLAFRFLVDDSASPVGAMRTAPTPGAATDTSLRLGIACCARLPIRPFDAYRDLADAGPDLVAFVGDYVYETAHVRHEPRHECFTADDYDRRYAQYRSQGPLQDLHATAPCVAIWDDHEIANASWSTGSPRDPMGSQRWLDRRRAAMGAFHRWMPQRAASGPTGIDRRVRWGELADVVLVDARQAGRQRPRTTGGPGIVADADDRRILTDAQWEWLERCVEEATGWFILCVSTQVSPLHLARWKLPLGRGARRVLVNPGQWDGYPQERRRLAAMLERVEGRVLVCSGDLHGRFLTRFETPSGDTVPEITTPSIASRPFASAVLRRAPIPHPPLRRWLRHLNPWIDDMALDIHGSTVLDIDHGQIAITSLVSERPTVRHVLARGTSRFVPVGSCSSEEAGQNLRS